MKDNLRKGFGLVLLLITSALFAEEPVWFIKLRDVVFEQYLSSNEVMHIYITAKDKAEAINSETEKLVMLARCENLMGQVYEREGQKSKAAAHYEQGESFAQSALAIQQTTDSYYVMAESIALQCNVKGLGYQMLNGMRFINNANNAISLNKHNTAAKYLLAAMYAFPNPPFRDLNKAKRTLDGILENDNEHMKKDVRFNVYYAMGVVYQKQKKPDDARYWFNMALTLYPTNKDAQNRLEEI
jgi:tetratricopeptide (TPR) repeat protein